MPLERGERWFQIFNVIFMCIFVAVIIFPLINVIALSLNDGYDAMKGGIYLYPRKFTLVNYETILRDHTIYRALGVTVMKTLVGVAGHLVITGMAAYAMSKSNLIGRKLFIRLGIISMFFYGGLIPTFLVIKSLGLANHFLVYVIPVLYSFYDMIILMNFFRGLPDSIEESAKIDGASVFQIFFKIVMPLSLPVFATIALFHGVYQWNDFFVAKLYVTDKSLYPIQYYLYQLLTSTGAANASKAGVYISKAFTTQSLQQATMIITTLPIMLVYPFLQKYFISGMLVGGVKE
ncbi:carbohydrate ABC transporter permease [Paenibacillus rhizovicinus]|uniref:Carbohydrate ABC transporter permease n=1 Tax=Paenibacillus rhizovicinus TaxID=2704463 RepID=A0A6C0P3R8_9BACL|nr:carbohydrate ABC transporter permease [Paenibacillus rhizovicinus]QHW32483.1 carbohydrate ABC transporter permease [Paenibacillus rhizovicinus]